MIGEQFINGWMNIPRRILKDNGFSENYGSESVFFAFFCYYLAFNHIYDAYIAKKKAAGCPLNPPYAEELNVCNTASEYWPDQRNSMLIFLEYALREMRRAGVIKFPQVPERLMREVYDRDGNPEHYLIQRLTKDIEDEQDAHAKERLLAERTFLRIYQVRCTLFHGGKDASKDDDKELVQVGAEYLEKYLLIWLNECNGVIFG